MKKKIVYISFCIFIFITLIIGVPLIINECYIKDEGYLTVWDDADVFAYYASVLSFLGTVILGALTVWQNRKAIEINDKLLVLEKKSKRGYFVPKYKIYDNVLNLPATYRHNLKEKGIVIIGNGDDNIYVNKTVVKINDNRIVQEDNRTFVTTTDEFREMYIPFNLTEEENKLDEIEIIAEIHMENSRGYKYVQTMTLDFKKENTTSYSLIDFNSDMNDE